MASSQNPNRKMKQVEEHRNWADLNGDVLLMIFHKLLSTIDVLMSGDVCHSWRKVAIDDPELYRRIDMRNFARNRRKAKKKAGVMKQLARVAIDRSKGNVEEFWIQYFGDEHLLKYLCKRTTNLKSLRLITCLSILDEDVAEIVKKQPILEDLQITSPFIEHLEDLADSEDEYDDSEEDEYEDEYDNGEEQEGKVKGNNGLLNLKQFKFETCTMYPTSNDDVVFTIARTMHQLRHLQLVRTGVTNRGLKAILKACPHLETLDIRASYYIEIDQMDPNMRALFANIKTVKLPLDSLEDYEYEAEAHYDSEEDWDSDFVPTLDMFYDHDCDSDYGIVPAYDCGSDYAFDSDGYS